MRSARLLGIDYTPHAAECDGPACNTSGEDVLPYAIQPTECHDVMVVHHYFTKSRGGLGVQAPPRQGRFALEPYQERVFADVAGEATIEDAQGAAVRPAAARAAANLTDGRAALDKRHAGALLDRTHGGANDHGQDRRLCDFQGRGALPLWSGWRFTG